MNLKRESDGSYLVLYDGSRTELLALISKLHSMAFAGIGDNLTIVFNGLRYELRSPRELSFFVYGIEAGMNSPFVEKMENHLSSIVDSIYKLNDVEDLLIEDHNDNNSPDINK